jgi:hypothetical protein
MKIEEKASLESLISQELHYANKMRKEAQEQEEKIYATGYYDGLYNLMQKSYK